MEQTIYGRLRQLKAVGRTGNGLFLELRTCSSAVVDGTAADALESKRKREIRKKRRLKIGYSFLWASCLPNIPVVED